MHFQLLFLLSEIFQIILTKASYSKGKRKRCRSWRYVL